ncbi:MAG: hypothetical protein JWM16_5649 [Verrucomicrobiales bacterium]|nr:hypothetical protein [Verrucomicrobiales bacterium]
MMNSFWVNRGKASKTLKTVVPSDHSHGIRWNAKRKTGTGTLAVRHFFQSGKACLSSGLDIAKTVTYNCTSNSSQTRFHASGHALFMLMIRVNQLKPIYSAKWPLATPDEGRLKTHKSRLLVYRRARRVQTGRNPRRTRLRAGERTRSARKKHFCIRTTRLINPNQKRLMGRTWNIGQNGAVDVLFSDCTHTVELDNLDTLGALSGPGHVGAPLPTARCSRVH